ncbi:MAG: hypothetical protein ACU0CO_09045 [Shimia sp.]
MLKRLALALVCLGALSGWAHANGHGSAGYGWSYAAPAPGHAQAGTFRGHRVGDRIDLRGSRVLECYEERLVPTRYGRKKTLVEPARKAWVKRKDQVQLVELPAVYEEERVVLEPAHRVLSQVPCK